MQQLIDNSFILFLLALAPSAVILIDDLLQARPGYEAKEGPVILELQGHCIIFGLRSLNAAHS